MPWARYDYFLGDDDAAHRRLVIHPYSPQEFKGYVFKIMGGQDKQGFPMRQGVLTPLRVRLLMAPGDPCFAGHGRRKGERRRKSVRGCIVSQDLSVLNLIIVKKGMCIGLDVSSREAHI